MLNFSEYCLNRSRQLIEMAQSRDEAKGEIALDDKDRDFIKQAMEADPRITEVSALRSRYTYLLQDKPGESGPCRFFGPGRVGDITVNIERTHLGHLQQKLRSAGFPIAAEHGFQPREDISVDDDKAGYYNTAFGRQNAADILGKNKAIDINYGRKTGCKVTIGGPGPAVTVGSDCAEPAQKRKAGGRKAATKTAAPELPTTAAAEPVAPPPSRPREVTVKPVPHGWAEGHLKRVFSDKKNRELFDRLLDMPELEGSKAKMYDFSDVADAVQTLVGDTTTPGKHIIPEVWALFQRDKDRILHGIYNGVRRKLKEFGDTGSLENIMDIKQAMMQTTAMVLSDPLRGNKHSVTGDYMKDVGNLFRDGKALSNLAASYCGESFVRKDLGVRSGNTRKREIGGMFAAAPVDADDMGREDSALDTNDVDSVRAKLSRMEPAIDKLRAKLNKADWDMSILDDEEHDLMSDYERLSDKLRELTTKKGYKGKVDGPAPAKRAIDPRVQALLTRKRAEFDQIKGPGKAAIKALDRVNWDMSRVPDEVWDAYTQYEKLEKEIKELEGRLEVDEDDLPVSAAATHHFRKNEVAGATGTLGPLDLNNPDYQVEGNPCSQVVLGFNAWCKRRERRGNGTGPGRKKGWDGI
jgi:hypothetical protein